MIDRNEEWLAHDTGQVTEPPEPEEEDAMQKLLSNASRRQNSEGWRMLLRAHDHVWRDREWDWRTRFDAAGLLWSKAKALFQENLLGRAA